MSVFEAVERDLAEIAARDPDLAVSAVAATARQLARELDGSNSATSKSMCAKALLETLKCLRELAPAVPRRDSVDELGEKRAKRRSAAQG